jgi:2'-5' RNA ligase
MANQRLFLALWPDAQARAALAASRDAWQWPRGAAVVRTEKLHVTLHFIGPVPAGRVDELRGRLALPVAPFELVLNTPRLWHGGLAVLEADAPPPELLDLHVRLGLALDALELPVEQRAYRPHVTFARKARGAVVPATTPVRWVVRDHALVLSAGGQYTVLERYGATPSLACGTGPG